MKTLKVSMKLAGASVTIEGPEDAVARQVHRFLEAQDKRAKPSTAEPSAPNPDNPLLHDEISPIGTWRLADGLSMNTIGTFFSTDGNDRVWLARRAPTEWLSLLLILYGLRIIAGKVKVTGATLWESAVASGLKPTRMDRIFGPLSALVVMEGARRAKRYQMTNKGLAFVESTLQSWAAHRDPEHPLLAPPHPAGSPECGDIKPASHPRARTRTRGAGPDNKGT